MNTGLGSAGVVVIAAISALHGATGHGAAVPRQEHLPVQLKWQVFTAADGLPDESVRAIKVDGGDVWVGTDGGLALRAGEGWSSWTAAEGLPRASISAIDVDRDTGDLWLGTWGGGLVRLTAGRFDRFTQFDSGLAGDLILDVALEGGRVWAATNGGISAYEPAADAWSLYVEPRANMPETAVTEFCPSRQGLYAGTWSGPLLLYDGAADDWTQLVEAQAGAGRGLSAAAAGRSIWQATRVALLRRVHGASWETAPLTGDVFVNCVAARSDSEAWIGTRAGLLVMADWTRGTWVTYRRPAVASIDSQPDARSRRDSFIVDSALPDNRIRCIAFQGDDVWVGTPRGLALGTKNATRGESPAAEDEPSFAPPSTTPARDVRTAIRIGILGPSTKPITRPGADSPWTGDGVDRAFVERAVAWANGRGSAQEQPRFALANNLYAFARYGWVTAQDSFATLRDRHDVRGFVGFIRPNARIDTAVALRTEVPVVNAAPTEPTTDESVNPWIFRCGNNDPRRHRLLLDYVLDSPGGSRLAAIHMPGPATAVHLDRLARHARTRGRELVAELDYDPEADDLSPLFDELRRSQADVVLTWSDARTSGALLRRMRDAGMNQIFVGGDLIVNRDFVAVAGANIGTVIALQRCPHLEAADDSAPVDGVGFGRLPGGYRVPVSPDAERSFDAAAHLLVAVELGGPDREGIREALLEMEQVTLARLENGLWHFKRLSPP